MRSTSAPARGCGPPSRPASDPALTGDDAILRLRGVVKRFGDATAVDGVDLDIHRGELFALLGASGCGKTTLLRLLAGFETPDSGRIEIDGADMAALPPYLRPVNMMFQSYALFPHMSVERNVAYGLAQERRPKGEIATRVAEALDLVEMGAFAARRPDQLSGGQRQRVALARAIIKRPLVLLLDEPLAALDRKLRERTRLELVELQRRLGITFVMVTHDQDEAMAMATRIAVMDRGRLVQCGAPAAVYERPADRFVADFIGSANILEARLVSRDGSGATFRCDRWGGDVRVAHPGAAAADAPAWLVLRPERIAVDRAGAGGANSARGTVRDIAYLGDQSILHVALDSGTVVQASYANVGPAAAVGLARGDAVSLSWMPDTAVVVTS
ncbi:MAG: ABC transporter ATP-binding protein [Rhodospirillales bacterium]|nr:MAG: ABC transporter ATP-binding protein [Rhodospirillales bacterium]